MDAGSGRAVPKAPSPYPDLEGKVAVVTGGSGGIGAATCRMLAAHGMRVVVTGRDQARIDAVVAGIVADGDQAIGVAADARDEAALAALRDVAEAELGPVHVLAAFAGCDGVPRPVAETPEAEWRATIDANLTTTFLATRTFVGGMIDRGAGSIVLMSSATARTVRPGVVSPAYAAAKGAAIVLSRHLAEEVGPAGVRVNCIAPSVVLTETERAKRTPAQIDELAASIPVRRLGVPDDVASATLFLASAQSSWITGVTLDVAGGRVMV
jgi:3-oxoacyl-[acyl-carrier protein] reductase